MAWAHRSRQRVGVIAVSLIAVGVLVFVLLAPETVRKPARPATARATPFAANSIWNARLPASAPIAANSSTLVAELQRQIATYGTWINTYSYSTPIYTVPADQARVPVVLDQTASGGSVAQLHDAFQAGVPIPTGARQAAGSDGDMVVWQPATNTLWELWIAHRVGSVWHAQWGGRMIGVSTNPGYFTDPADWGTAATSLSLLGGTIRIAELRSGHIDHALSISIPQARQGVFAAPAQRTDGKLTSPNAIPEGTRFRLDPKLNIAALGLPPATRALAIAAQRYGLLVRDQSGVVAFYGEQNTTGPDPYYGAKGLFGGSDPKSLTQPFPWSHLQVVRSALHTVG